MDVADRVGADEREEIVVALEIAGPCSEPLAAIFLLAEPEFLDLGSHPAVEDENAAAELLREELESGGPVERRVIGHWSFAAGSSPRSFGPRSSVLGRSPSM